MNRKNTRYFLIPAFCFLLFVIPASAQTNCGTADYDCIIDYQTRQIEADKNNAEAFYARGRAYKSKGAYDLAMTDMDTYLSFDIKDKSYLADGLRERAWLRRHEGDRKGAVWDLSRAIEENPGEIEAYYVRGDIYIELTFFDDAIKDFTKYIGLVATRSPLAADGHAGRAQAYNAIKKYSLAIQDLNIAIGIKPKEPLFYQERAYAYRSLGKKALADADDAKAIALQQ